MLFIGIMTQIIEQNTQNHAQESSAASDSTAHSGNASALRVAPENASSLPGHLEALAGRARGYIEAQ